MLRWSLVAEDRDPHLLTSLVNKSRSLLTPCSAWRAEDIDERRRSGRLRNLVTPTHQRFSSAVFGYQFVQTIGENTVGRQSIAYCECQALPEWIH